MYVRERTNMTERDRLFVSFRVACEAVASKRSYENDWFEVHLSPIPAAPLPPRAPLQETQSERML